MTKISTSGSKWVDDGTGVIPKSSRTIGATGTRVPKVWATDVEVTNAIAGDVTGNAATVTTNANLTGHVTSTGNAAVLGSFTKAQLDTAVSDGTLAEIAATQTLTNKRVTPRVSTEASSATPTINTDNVDAHSITALAAAVTSMTTNLSGTPTNFQKLTIRFKDDGTARAITWGASFEDAGAVLPTTTVISKLLTAGFIYNSVTSKWGCVAAVNET